MAKQTTRTLSTVPLRISHVWEEEKAREDVTGQPALIYIPPGTYAISSSIQLFIGTQVVGDAISPPVIKARDEMRNNIVMIAGYNFRQPSTTNFYIELRNVVINSPDAAENYTIYGLNWASQATNLINGTSSIVLENIDVRNSGPTLKVNGTSRALGNLVERTCAQGHVHRDAFGKLIATNGTYLPYTERGSLIGADGKYFTNPQPQYTSYPASAFASVKDAGAKGDAITDDTQAMQQVLLSNVDCKITFFPHGVYLVTETIYVPPGSRIVGQALSPSQPPAHSSILPQIQKL